MKTLKFLAIAILTTFAILPATLSTTATAATTKQQTAVQKKTPSKAVKKLHFNKKTKVFSGLAKPHQQIYLTSPADKNFGEGVATADKNGHFKAEWATTPKKIYVYPFNKKGRIDKKITYVVKK